MRSARYSESTHGPTIGWLPLRPHFGHVYHPSSHTTIIGIAFDRRGARSVRETHPFVHAVAERRHGGHHPNVTGIGFGSRAAPGLTVRAGPFMSPRTFPRLTWHADRGRGPRFPLGGRRTRWHLVVPGTVSMSAIKMAGTARRHGPPSCRQVVGASLAPITFSFSRHVPQRIVAAADAQAVLETIPRHARFA